MDEPKKLAIGKIRHKQSEDEKKFYLAVGKAMHDARVSANVSQAEMGEQCGYSSQQIRNFEKGKTPIPAYVMMQYSVKLNVSAEEISASWADDQTKSLFQNLVTERAVQQIKRLTENERLLISWLRIEHKRTGTMDPAALIPHLKKRDLDLIYCMKRIEASDESEVQDVEKSIRRLIYDLYMLHGNDEKGSADITENLDGTPKDIHEQEVKFDEE